MPLKDFRAAPALAAILGILGTNALGQSVAPAVQTGPAAHPQLTVARVSAGVRLDGRLGDPAWATADSVELTQVEPRQGAPATARTVVRVLTTGDGLVIGIRADDPEPGRLVSFARQRDATLDSEDHIKLVLDTYLDGRSGYVFAVNPKGQGVFSVPGYDVVSGVASVAIPLLVAAGVVEQRRGQAGARPLAWMMISVAFWTVAGGLELLFLDLPSNITWSKVSYLGIVNIAPFLLVFVLEYTGRERWLTRPYLAVLWAVPVVILLLVATNEWHHWIWSSVVPNPDPFNPIPIFYHGIGYWIFLAYTYVILFVASAMLIWTAVRLPRSNRAQLIAILVGVPLPWLANVLYVSGKSPVPVWDLAPIAFGLAGFALSLGIYRFRLLDLVPLARDKVYESLHDGLVVLDPQSRIVDINPAAGAMIGKNIEQVFGRPFGEFFPGLLELLGRGGVTEMPMGPERAIWMEVQVSELRNSRQVLTGQLVALHDISERKAVEQALEAKSRELARLAVTDVLTQLYNRRYAEDVLRAEFQRASRYHVPLSLALFDIDLFKQINDSFGHAVGDDVLREVAARLHEAMRGSDIVARVGGDEFLVILPNTGLQDAWLAVERFRSRLSEKEFEPIGEAITISGGVTAWFSGDEPDEALRRADRLLYRAKGAGRKTILKDEQPAPEVTSKKE